MSDRSVGPQIEGLTCIEHLGSGGYSDVYLYEQRRPKMRVAVKVLTDSRLSEAELSQFASEAETMAELAHHPYIVQVFQTGTTDDGRPYLVMKYYPPPNLGKRASAERLTVAEVLRTGIQLSSAVETAHRAGILHRDIKPANVLLSQYGEPGLADFGIAGKTADTEAEDDLGVSIPWSPPEILSGASNGSVVSDVYSLAATLWHLLAGRSPFEVPGGDNSSRALMGRILRSVPPATGRADAPASLERLLQQAMSKNPQVRPQSALEFARLLQGVEQELRYGRTTIVVDGDTGPRAANPTPPTSPAQEAQANANSLWAPAAKTAEGGHGAEPATTQRPVRVTDATKTPVGADAASRTGEARAEPAPSPPSGGSDGTRMRPVAQPQLGSLNPRRSVDDPPPTTRRPVAAKPEPVPPPPAPRRLPKAAVAGIGAGVSVIAIVVAVLLIGSGHGRNRPQSNETTIQPTGRDQGGLGPDSLPPPSVTSSYDSATHVLAFHWTFKGAAAGQRYTYAIGSARPSAPTVATSTSIKTADPAATCITVGSVGSDGTSHLAAPVCG